MRCCHLLSTFITLQYEHLQGQPLSLSYMVWKKFYLSKVKYPHSEYSRTQLDEDEWVQTRLDQINLINEKRLAAICHGQIYQKRMTKAFNKKVKHRVYQVGDLVVKRIILPQGDFC